MDGVEATRRIASAPVPESGSGPRVLILTTFDLDQYLVEALRAGASGFLLKDVPPEELAAAIRVTAAGEALLAPSITRRLLDRFAPTFTVSGETRRPAALTGVVVRAASSIAPVPVRRAMGPPRLADEFPPER